MQDLNPQNPNGAQGNISADPNALATQGALQKDAGISTTVDNNLTPDALAGNKATAALKDPTVPLVSPGANPNILSSKDATTYLNNVQDSVKPYTPGDMPTSYNPGTATDNTPANSLSKGGALVDSTTKAAGFDPMDPVGSLARMAYAPSEARINAEYQPVKEGDTAAERSATLTAEAGQVRNGQAATAYGYQAMNDLALSHQRDMLQLDQKEQQAKNDAWDAALRGAAGEVMQAQAARDNIQADKLKAQALAATQMKEVADATKAIQGDVSDTMTTFLKSGNTPTTLQLQTWDNVYNMTPGTSKMLLDAAQADFARTDAKNTTDARNAAVDSAKKITDFLDSQPTGAKITIGGQTYYGTGKGNLKTGVEVDKATGKGLYYEYDPSTGRTTTTPMGTVGFNDPNWEIKQDDQGRLWRVSANTGQMIQVGGSTSLPMTPGPTQKTNAAVYPDGSVGPTLPGHENNAGQCGAACNYWYDKGLLPDSFAGKQQALSSYEVKDKEQLQAHDTFLMKSGSTGHVGVVGDIYTDPVTGKEMFTATESNMVPPGQGLLSNTRVMAVDDPRIAMFARVPTPNLPPSGGDSAVTLAASGAPTFGAKSAADNKPLSPTEIKAYGLDPSDPKNASLTASTIQGRLQDIRDQNGGNLPLSADQESAAQDLANYTADMKTITAGRTGSEREALLARAKAIDPNFDVKQYDIRKKYLANYTSGDIGTGITAITKAVDHISDLNDSGNIVTSKRLSSHIPGSNIVGDAFANITGTSGDLKAYNMNADAVASELTKVFRGGGGTETDVQSWKNSLNDRNSPSENKLAIQKGLDLMAGQVKGIFEGYKRAMGGEPKDPIISQDDIQKIKSMGYDTSKLERYSLGAPPDGQMYVKDKTDKIGAIPFNEFNTKLYTKY